MTVRRALSGAAASEGIAIGDVRLMVPRVVVVDRRVSPDRVPAEVSRLREAVTVTDEQLGLLSARLEADDLHEGHLIVEAHRMMLRDAAVVEAARRVIDDLVATFDRMKDPYLRERSADIEAIGDRLLRTLLGLPEVLPDGLSAPGSIGVSSLVSPIDALHLPRSGLVGFATERGGKTSHAAIILRAL